MPSAFPGFSPEAMRFFRGLRRNNRRDWFLPRKPIFEEHVRRPMLALVDALNRALLGFAPAHVTDPEKAVYRFYRDTRFSADKTPYKDHIAANFPRRGSPKHGAAGYYFSVADNEIEVGGGVYLPEPDTLDAIRRHIAVHHQEFRRLEAARAVQKLYGGMQGEQTSRVPRGFDPAHPAADLLRYKQFLLFTTLDPAIATTPALYKELVKHFRAMAPFIDFLNAPLTRARAASRTGIVLHRAAP
jgi:uncharacterized protein (TIGR02453 family)